MLLEEQLLMFEVANWLKNNTKSIVFLPLRETTFDHYRHQKPLDTVVKDLIFRINPPSLEKVIYNRISYAKRLSDKKDTNFYFLPNGMKVSYPSGDELSYLRSILKSLFQNSYFKKMLTGMAGRDIRKGIEFFLDFCKSGHISDGDIFQMKQSKGKYELPNHVVSKVFIRGNRVYYNDADAKVKNLFYSDPSDKLPDPFARVAILQWLKDGNKVKGPSGIMGFHKYSDILGELNLLGHSVERLKSEILNLLKSTLIISESQDTTVIHEDELISINTPGVVHLELITSVDYLSSCSEDVWYRKEATAIEISKRISGKTRFSHYSLQTSIANSESLIEYLEKYNEDFFLPQKDFIDKSTFQESVDFKSVKKTIASFKTSVGFREPVIFETNKLLKAKIVNIFDYGLICELENTKQVGLLHVSELATSDIGNYEHNQILDVEIIEFQQEHKKYKLKLAASN